MHDAFTIGVPLVAILFGILFNRQGLNDLKLDLKNEIRASEERLTARVSFLERDYRDFYKTQAQLETRMDAIEKKPQAEIFYFPGLERLCSRWSSR